MKRRLKTHRVVLALLTGLALGACGPAEQQPQMESSEDAAAGMAGDSMVEGGTTDTTTAGMQSDRPDSIGMDQMKTDSTDSAGGEMDAE